MRTAIYPGSFDPVTLGHVDLMSRASRMFDKLIVAVVEGTVKNYLFNIDERFEQVKDAAKNIDGVEVVAFSGLLARFVENQKAVAIVRGLRAVSDFEYEFQLALMNRQLTQHAETVFLMPSLRYVYLSSSLVKDVAKNAGDISKLVTPKVEKALSAKYGNGNR